MRKVWTLALGAGLAMTLAACSSGGGGDGTATCTPHGPALRITARNVSFDTDCLAAPADRPLTIAFDNEDSGTPHNVSISSDAASDALFTGERFSGVKTETYRVPALDAGTYRFQCDVHPSMDGTFVVAQPPAPPSK